MNNVAKERAAKGGDVVTAASKSAAYREGLHALCMELSTTHQRAYEALQACPVGSVERLVASIRGAAARAAYDVVYHVAQSTHEMRVLMREEYEPAPVPAEEGDE